MNWHNMILLWQKWAAGLGLGNISILYRHGYMRLDILLHFGCHDIVMLSFPGFKPLKSKGIVSIFTYLLNSPFKGICLYNWSPCVSYQNVQNEPNVLYSDAYICHRAICKEILWPWSWKVDVRYFEILQISFENTPTVMVVVFSCSF